MQDLKMEGVGSISGGEYDSVKVEGVCNCSSSIKAKEMSIEGVFNCAGELEVGYIYCEGVANTSNIRAKRITVEGVLKVKGEGKLEAEEIRCDGVIKTSGEISADILNAEGCISAKEIVGDSIKIDSHNHGRHFLPFTKKTGSRVSLIEATTIELSNVEADTVNGKDIVIGPYCRIENIDCSGTLSIHRDAYVRNITGDYTMNN